MEASSVARRLRAGVDVREWAWWRLPRWMRAYVGAVPLAWLALAGYAASQTSWRSADLVTFGLLLGCGLISVGATARAGQAQSSLMRDFLTVWVLPVAILLPPVYALVTPMPLLAMTQWRIHRGLIYRRVFTGAAIGLAYGAASVVFRAIPASVAGPALGSGMHALTWAVCVAGCEVIGWLGHNALLVIAVRLSDPTARLAELALNREALLADFAQMDLGILLTVVVAGHPVLAVFGVPTVLLARRFMMHAQLLAKSRIDHKTGLLNVSTWEAEAEKEIARAIRTRSPLSMALIDIDHFKMVNDTYGHLAGDRALRAVTDTLREQLRSYDLAGRFGGDEFAIILPQTREANAVQIAERLRTHIADLAIAVRDDDLPGGDRIRLTISVGVAALDEHNGELTHLIAATDAALYAAKQTGRNKTHAATAGSPLAQMIPAARSASDVLDFPDTSRRLPASPLSQWNGRASSRSPRPPGSGCSHQTTLPVMVRRAPQRCESWRTTCRPRPFSSSPLAWRSRGSAPD
jgi:diguanylate cyclase (GGDEF)-like protein